MPACPGRRNKASPWARRRSHPPRRSSSCLPQRAPAHAGLGPIPVRTDAGPALNGRPGAPRCHCGAALPGRARSGSTMSRPAGGRAAPQCPPAPSRCSGSAAADRTCRRIARDARSRSTCARADRGPRVHRRPSGRPSSTSPDRCLAALRFPDHAAGHRCAGAWDARWEPSSCGGMSAGWICATRGGPPSGSVWAGAATAAPRGIGGGVSAAREEWERVWPERRPYGAHAGSSVVRRPRFSRPVSGERGGPGSPPCHRDPRPGAPLRRALPVHSRRSRTNARDGAGALPATPQAVMAGGLRLPRHWVAHARGLVAGCESGPSGIVRSDRAGGASSGRAALCGRFRGGCRACSGCPHMRMRGQGTPSPGMTHSLRVRVCADMRPATRRARCSRDIASLGGPVPGAGRPGPIHAPVPDRLPRFRRRMPAGRMRPHGPDHDACAALPRARCSGNAVRPGRVHARGARSLRPCAVTHPCASCPGRLATGRRRRDSAMVTGMMAAGAMDRPGRARGRCRSCGPGLPAHGGAAAVPSGKRPAVRCAA